MSIAQIGVLSTGAECAVGLRDLGVPAATAPAGGHLETIGHNDALGVSDRESERDIRERERRRRDQPRLSGVLKAVGRSDEANQVEQCGRVWAYECSSCGGVAYRRAAASCDHVLCGYCLHRKAADRARKWAPALDWYFASPGTYPVRFELTQLRVPGESLAAAAERFNDNLTRLYRRPEWREHMRGALIAVEIAHTKPGRKGGWGPHAHGIADMPVYWDLREFSRLWFDVTGDSTSVKIQALPVGDRAAFRRAIAEVIKYPVKVAEFLDRPGLVGEYLDWREGEGRKFRTFRQLGSFQGLLKRAEEQIAGEWGVTVEEYEAGRAAVEASERAELVALESVCPFCGAVDSMKGTGKYVARWDTVPVNGAWYRWSPLPGG